MTHPALRVLLISLLPSLMLGVVHAAPAAELVDFQRDIRPIFVAHCNKCHGAKKNEGGLRLNTKRAALAGGDSGEAIIPGKAAASDLIERITSGDEDEQMPPKGKGKPLTATQVTLLRTWIDQGAKWPDGIDPKVISDHWAFKPIGKVEPPKRAEPNVIDRFVLARLAKEGIKPSLVADRHTLIRRLSLDLIGLPPTVEEIEQFVGDQSAGTYERLVDRLLASPHFGERWAMHWLDLSRYADSDGYEKDLPRPNAYHWRDWLIEAHNRDLPFDQFTVQQIAGDLLPGATNEVKLATGFHRNTLTNREGGVDAEEFRVKAVVDRNNTTFGVWMGLTVGCAECHSHKYDPISQREFYSLYAFFNEAAEQDITVPKAALSGAHNKQLVQHNKILDELQAKFDAQRPALEKRFATWTAQQQAALEEMWTPLEVVSRKAAGDGVLEVVAKTKLARVTALRLQLPKSAAGKGIVVSHLSVTAHPAGTKAGGSLLLAGAEAVTAKGRRDIGKLLDAKDTAGWSPAAFGKRPATAYIVTAGSAGTAGWLGNSPVDGSQDSAPNLLNVYYQSPISASGTVDRIRVFTKGGKGGTFAVYLLRPDGGSHRVVYRQQFKADGSTSEKAFQLKAAWSVRPGDVFAHSGNSGPTFGAGGGTKDVIYYPFAKLPAQGGTIQLAKQAKLASRKYAMQVNFIPAAAPGKFVKPQWDDRGATLTLHFHVSKGSLDEIQVAATQVASPLSGNVPKLPGVIVRLLRIESGQRTAEQQKKLFEHFLARDDTAKKLQKQISDHKKKTPKMPSAKFHVMRQGSPRPTHVHLRGNFLTKGVEVKPGTPTFLPPLVPRAARPDRLDLARWIADGKNPLTARVAVNHTWSLLFGRGFVSTKDDFGTQGQKPTQPELLDWLAGEFQRLGWSRKKLIRLIVTSQTYRQASRVRADLKDRDPANALLSRQNRFRLEAELVRDHYLASAKLLNRQVGGPSFRPPLPASVTRVQFVNKWKASPSTEQYRRGMYIHLQRNMLLPMLTTFDRPDVSLSCARRERSNTPLQALTLLNGATFVDAARALAADLAGTTTLDDGGRVEQMFLRAVSRPPSTFERERTAQLLDELTKYYAASPEEAKKLVGDKHAAQWKQNNVPPQRAASWIAVCRTILNLDEVITRE
jgi:hypothetical protein